MKSLHQLFLHPCLVLLAAPTSNPEYRKNERHRADRDKIVLLHRQEDLYGLEWTNQLRALFLFSLTLPKIQKNILGKSHSCLNSKILQAVIVLFMNYKIASQFFQF